MSKTTEERRIRHRDWYAYSVDVRLDGKGTGGGYVCATKKDAVAVARREGRRMWKSGVFASVECEVARRTDRKTVVFRWVRPVYKSWAA